MPRLPPHEMGHGAAALAYALQFEGAIRQWDVVGKWLPLVDKKVSSIIDGTSKWVGPMWSQIDGDMIMRYTPAKTQFTSGARVVLDLKMLPMVMEELAKVPVEARQGPLIVNPRTGLPYRNWYYGEVWRRVRKITGIRKEVWNRDMRAAGVTEAREGAAHIDDVAKTPVIPSGRPQRSMTAPGCRPRGALLKRAKRSENRVCRNASRG
jgi:hypothetical protein